MEKQQYSKQSALYSRLFFHYTVIWDPLIISSEKPGTNRTSSIDNIQCWKCKVWIQSRYCQDFESFNFLNLRLWFREKD